MAAQTEAMAATESRGTSRLGDWPGWPMPGSPRFCENGHLVYAGGLGAFPEDVCKKCGSRRFVVFYGGRRSDHNTEVPVPRKPKKVIRRWLSVEAYGRNGNRLCGVRRRVKIPVFDIGAFPPPGGVALTKCGRGVEEYYVDLSAPAA